MCLWFRVGNQLNDVLLAGAVYRDAGRAVDGRLERVPTQEVAVQRCFIADGRPYDRTRRGSI